MALVTTLTYSMLDQKNISYMDTFVRNKLSNYLKILNTSTIILPL